MTEMEYEPHQDAAAVRLSVTQMLERNEWRLLDADTLTQRVMALICGTHQIEGGQGRNRPAISHRRTTGPIEGAALRGYAETLYAAYAGAQGDERQQRAYKELFAYIYRVACRRARDLAPDEREEVTYQVLADLYGRLSPRHEPTMPPPIRIPGAFLAVALQQVENTLRRWRSASQHLLQIDDAADETTDGYERGLHDHADPASDLHTQAEDMERRARVRASFKRAIAQYPRARLQLEVVWMHIIEDRDYPAIATLLAMTTENVRVLYSRGLKRLRNDPVWRALADEECALDRSQPISSSAHHSIDKEARP